MATTIFVLISLVMSNSYAQMLRPKFSQAEQLVVLKNGEILMGQVNRNAEQVIVETEQGSRLVIPADQFDFVCQSMDQAYWGRAARTKATDIEGQQQLFYWCLKNKLLDHAQNQIDILLQMNVTASELENLDRQLNVALMQQHAAERRMAQAADDSEFEFRQPKEAQVASQPVLKLAPINVENSIGSKNLIGQADNASVQFDLVVFRPLPGLDADSSKQTNQPAQFVKLPPLSGSTGESIRQVGFEEEIFDTISPTKRMLSPASIDSATPTKSTFELPPLGGPLRDDRIMTSIPDLNRETRSLPDGVAGHYRRRVERALIFGCNASKCHDSDSRTMPLLQTSSSQPITRLQSQRNLHNVLKYVDRSNPLESELFLAATQLHAGLDQPIFRLDSERGENLLKWLVIISDNPQSTLLAAVHLTESNQVSTQNAESGNGGGLVPVKPNPLGLAPLDDSSLAFPDTIGEIPKLDASEKAFVPIDPFDPEIFNRRFRR